MKELLKKMIPSTLLRWYYVHRYSIHLRRFFLYDLKRYCQYSRREDLGEGKLALTIMAAHGIEKGLAMPAFRYGFGQERIEKLLQNNCEGNILIP